jgi:hypothetical protein
MIGFDYLGKMGRLCNQMFQYAATKGISMNRDFEFCIPYPSGNDEWEHHRFRRLHLILTNNYLRTVRITHH